MAISYTLQVTGENPQKSSNPHGLLPQRSMKIPPYPPLVKGEWGDFHINFQPSAFSLQPIRNPLTLPLLLFLCLILFQIVPLPPSVIKRLSPNTYQLYQQTLPGWPTGQDTGYRIQDTDFNSTNPTNPTNSKPATRNLQPATDTWKPISIYPHATKTEFLKILACIGIFFLIINNLTGAKQIRRVILAIIITGSVVALLGLLQMLSGADKIYWFWQSRYWGEKPPAFFGPYVNNNHFAGYMEMVIPLSLGLLITQSLNYSITHGGSWRYRLSTLDSWLSANVLLIFAIVIMIASLFFSLSRTGIISFLLSMVLFVNGNVAGLI